MKVVILCQIHGCRGQYHKDQDGVLISGSVRQVEDLDSLAFRFYRETALKEQECKPAVPLLPLGVQQMDDRHIYGRQSWRR